MPDPPFWSRVKNARLFQVLVIYLGASWVVLQVVDSFIERMGLPSWTWPWTLVLLLLGLVIVLVTAWVQSHPLMPQREAADEVPSDWELDVSEIKESVTSGRLPHLNWARALIGGAAAFLLLFGFAGLYVVVQDRGRNFSPSEALAGAAPGIAVLPFTVEGEGLDAMRDGMVSLLSTGLDGAGGLRTIAPGTVFARWDERVSRDRTPELPTALEIARQSGARYALIGSAVSIGSSVRLVADVYEVETGDRLGQAQVEGSPDDVLPLVDRVGVEVLRIVLQRREEIPEINLERLTTGSPEALKAYLEGEVHFRNLDIEAARQAYTRAVEADSTFALAHSRLGATYGWSPQNRTLRRRHLERAFQMSDRLTERDALFVRAGRARSRRSVDELESLREAVRTYPDDASLWYELAETLLHVPGATAPEEEVEAAFKRAVELDPRNAQYLYHYTEFPFTARPDSAEAARRLAMYDRATSTGRASSAALRLALDLAFGDSVAQADAMTQLATEEYEVVRNTSWYLLHPRHRQNLAVTEMRLRRASEGNNFGGAFNSRSIMLEYYGRFRELLTVAADPRLASWLRADQLHGASEFGFPVREDLLEEAIASIAIDKVEEPFRSYQVWLVGAHAADQGRWSEYEQVVAELERRATLARAEADPREVSVWTWGVNALRGYGLWKKGDPEAAAAILGDPSYHNFWWELGQIYQELGRFRDAERIYLNYNFPPENPVSIHPLAQRELGKVYEALGEYDKAREAYEYFVEYWADADPELQPMVEEAREAVARLTPLQRE
jgi:serine/threonine-protein kinase